MYLSDVFTIPVNLAGIPAITLRAASAAGDYRSACRSWGNISMRETLRVAYTFEQNTDFHLKEVPPIA